MNTQGEGAEFLRDQKAHEFSDALIALEQALRHQWEDLSVVREELRPWGELVKKYPWTSSLLVSGAALAVGYVIWSGTTSEPLPMAEKKDSELESA